MFLQPGTHPDGNVLERLIWTVEEADEILVKTAFRLVPNGVEWSVVFGGCRGDANQSSTRWSTDMVARNATFG
jgi:hypothetical protein